MWEHATRHQERVEENGVGKMGEMPHGKVDKEVAAATGLGTETTDHQWTDGVSLVTPASGPQDDQKVGLNLVKPPPSPPPPTSQTGGRTTDGGSTATEDHHTASVKPQPRMVSQKVDEKTGSTTNPNAERTEPTTPADSSSDPPDTPLDEQAGHELGK